MEMKSDHPPTDLQLKLVASDSTNAELPEGISLKMAVEYKTQDRFFKANPSMVVLPAENAIVMLGSHLGDTLEMRIKAVRQ